ncbi:hypothetical protein ACUL41_17870 [Virgibacillus natechei]
MSNAGFEKRSNDMEKNQNTDVKKEEAVKDVATAPKKESSSKKRRKPVKPDGFKEFEELAKEIIEADGSSYYAWLHERHQEIILNFNVSNQKKITDVVKKGE